MKREKGFKEATKGGHEIEHLGEVEVEMDAEMEARIKEMTRLADEEDDECRVNFRWKRDQVALVKAVADRMGVPYQTYIKQVVSRQALSDLQAYRLLDAGSVEQTPAPKVIPGLPSAPSTQTYPQLPQDIQKVHEK